MGGVASPSVHHIDAMRSWLTTPVHRDLGIDWDPIDGISINLRRCFLLEGRDFDCCERG